MPHADKIVDGIPIKYVCQPCPECKAKLEAAEEMLEALKDARVCLLEFSKRRQVSDEPLSEVYEKIRAAIASAEAKHV